jgi:hypothetical protein
MPSVPVYLDTCVILAACRAGCWPALMGGYDLQTTDVCRRELLDGNRYDPKYVAVDMAEFDRRVRIHTATPAQVAAAGLAAPILLAVDAGERTLLAWCKAQTEALLLTTGDRAAVNAACALGLQERLVSLEELAIRIGMIPRLPRQFTRAWLAEVRSEYVLNRSDL